MGTHKAIALGLIIYAALMLAVSLYWMRKVKKPADYLVGGRNLPFWVLAGNITAGCIGTGVIIGASGLAYEHGWAGSAWPIGLGIGTIVAGWMFASMRRFKFMTLSEEIASYYGGNRAVVEFSNITLFLSQLCWLTVQIMGGASVIATVTGLSHGWSVLAAGLITASIAIPGGFKSVVYTDFLQCVILLIGFGVAAWSALSHTGGFTGLGEAVPLDYYSFLGMDSYGKRKLISLMAALAISIMADPGRRLSMYSARTESGAKWAMVAAGLIVIAFSVVVSVTGMYAFTLNPHLPDRDQAMLWLVMNILPAWLAAFVVVSVASGIFSCANSNAMSVSTFFVRHIFPLATGRYPQRSLLVARVSLAGAFVLCTLVALRAGTIVDFVSKFLPVVMSGLAIVVVLGRFWPRSTWQGAMTALTVTPVVSLAAIFSKSRLDNAVILLAPGFIGHVVVSLLTPPNTRPAEDVAVSLARERAHIEGEPEAKIGATP
ncbi:MAG TPA: sodium:solute symporter family protein [Verrucomicrobiae bacterium]|jgi:SSS family solute:Na+ symporter